MKDTETEADSAFISTAPPLAVSACQRSKVQLDLPCTTLGSATTGPPTKNDSTPDQLTLLVHTPKFLQEGLEEGVVAPDVCHADGLRDAVHRGLRDPELHSPRERSRPYSMLRP